MKKTIIIISIFIGLSFFTARVRAEEPAFFVSWKTNSYTPSWYSGKRLPSLGSSLNVSFDLIEGGKVVDLSSEKIRWYINNKLFKNENNGLGIKSITRMVTEPGDYLEVRITLPEHNGGFFDKVVLVPIASPEAVISAPYLGGIIDRGTTILEGIPFFFNVETEEDFNFGWKIDGKDVKDQEGASGNILDLKIPTGVSSGQSINADFIVQSMTNLKEKAERLLKLKVK